MLKIGFATQFYTLWNVEVESNYSTVNGVHYLSGQTARYNFIKNISTSLEKTKALYPDLDIDDSLRGKTGNWERQEKLSPPFDLFPFGKLACMPIIESADVWQLDRLYHLTSVNPRTRVLARRRLIELGELVRLHMD